MIETFNALRLGDNLAHLHFMRNLASAFPDFQFRHEAHARYIPELSPLIEGIPNLRLGAIADSNPRWWEARGSGVNAWKNADHYWDNCPRRNNYSVFMLEWFDHLARKLGLESPLRSASDLLFDYPALFWPASADSDPLKGREHRILVVNSPAQSGQATGVDPSLLDQLVIDLAVSEYGRVVYCTHPLSREPHLWPDNLLCTNSAARRLSVTEIGRLSIACGVHVMISTGPSWPTFNIWNSAYPQGFRALLIDSEFIDFGPPDKIHHARTVQQVRLQLERHGLL